MSKTTSSKLAKKSTSTNKKVASSIVHKPFSTGTINIFHPPKSNPNGEMISSKLVVNATLEESGVSEQLLTIPQSKHWFNLFLNPWGISAIAVLLLANVFSGVLIWRNSLQLSSNLEVEPQGTDVGNYNLAAQEFVPLNLNTLSTLSSSAAIVTDDEVESEAMQVEIPPALLPLNINNSLASLDTQYHYILTEYTGDRSLELVRQKVNSISLVNLPQGVFIYMGGFTQKTAAVEFLAQLKAAGINAYIYPFKSY